jgi:hypothetical protein
MGFLGPFGQQAEAMDPPAASEDIKKNEGPAFKLKTPASQVSIIDHEASCSHRYTFVQIEVLGLSMSAL